MEAVPRRVVVAVRDDATGPDEPAASTPAASTPVETILRHDGSFPTERAEPVGAATAGASGGTRATGREVAATAAPTREEGNGEPRPSAAPQPDPPAASGRDDGALQSEVETYEAVASAAERVLDDVDRALARLDDGTYGTCRLCRQPIGDDRLRQDPTATGCERHLDLTA